MMWCETNLNQLDLQTIHYCLKEWLRENDDPSKREFVGVGFMNLKQLLFEQSTMKNVKIKILDSNYQVAAYLKTYDYGGFFRTKWRIRSNEAVRYDTVGRIKETFHKAFDHLVQLFRVLVGGVVRFSAITY